jgi:ADP-dependent NAD(P)H-hydrate dehydratase
MKSISKNSIRKFLPERTASSNKTDGGKVLIVGGGPGLYGAGILAALAATRTGSGYTHLMTDLDQFPWLKFPDFIIHPLSLKELKNKQEFVVAIGPGLGVPHQNKKYIKYLLKNNFQKVIVDADGLTLLSQMKIKLPPEWILTPHEGELARLLGITSNTVVKNKIECLIRAQKKYGCIILLKGAETLVTDSSENIYKIKEGTPALAKAGSGDVLTGMIAALLAQNLSPIHSAITGAFIHGYSSQLWMKKKKDYLSMRPIDLIEIIPEALFKLRTSR